MKISRKSYKNNGGFTLLEILISISLLSLLMVATGSTIKTISQTQIRVNERLNQLDSQKATIEFLRSIISQISGFSPKATQHLKKGAFFVGNSSSIEWLGNMPARIGMGGLTYFRISLVNNFSGSSDLVLQYSSFQNNTVPSWENSEYYTLVNSIKEFSINYLSEENYDEVWVNNWPFAQEENGKNKSDIPLVISFEIQDEKYGIWPLIYLKLNNSAISLPSNNSFTIGGSKI